ncbi:MAG TPA: hypothetical protein DCW68_01835 [Rhodospirillaceae bacterium]|nr:MAG: hypothetical protein A2018_04800 [Alphaproteobacteria bacterium GWF2_58_20]HAU28837.1 hypothetical protein [Rhodospirillaceae bacterium]
MGVALVLLAGSARAAALDSRYDPVAKSLDSLLNEGWMITQAFATQRLDGVLLELNGKYVHCKLSNLYRSSGMSLQSECFSLN